MLLISIGSIRDALAISIAFSAVPPAPIPIIPGGHQPAPIVGIVLRTQSVRLSSGLSTVNFDLFSDPPPFAATVISNVSPLTILV